MPTAEWREGGGGVIGPVSVATLQPETVNVDPKSERTELTVLTPGGGGQTATTMKRRLHVCD